MRKMLLTIALVAMIIIFGVVAVNGINIGNITVWGFNQIREGKQYLKDKNDKLTNLVDTEYPKQIEAVAESETQLKTAKEEYESQVALNSDSENGFTAATEKYEIEYLWTKIGNHAKDNDVEMKIDLTNSSIGTGYYKLNFTVTGSYVGITDFIYAIENDSKLGFKIDDFVMTQNTQTNTSSDKNSEVEDSKVTEVKATFSCDEVGINIQSIEKQADTQEEEDTTNTTSDNTSKSNTTSDTKTASNLLDEETDE